MKIEEISYHSDDLDDKLEADTVATTAMDNKGEANDNENENLETEYNNLIN